LKRLAVPLSLVLLAAFAGCRRHPMNPLLGSWTSTTPSDAYGADGCPTHYRFTDETQTLTMPGGQTVAMQVRYDVKPDLVVVKMKLRSNSFKFLTPDSVAWTTGSCTYKRD
jgi:hypothetical protein